MSDEVFGYLMWWVIISIALIFDAEVKYQKLHVQTLVMTGGYFCPVFLFIRIHRSRPLDKQYEGIRDDTFCIPNSMKCNSSLSNWPIDLKYKGAVSIEYSQIRTMNEQYDKIWVNKTK